jgi:ubiquinone/menaquinone biosynthesis C-methylase UbiE
MNTRDAYNQWADSYDTVQNKTRDLEGKALREVLGTMTFSNVLEIGCGTGKNTSWLIEKAVYVTAADFSPQMLEQAKQKIQADHVRFIEMDITQPWKVPIAIADLVTFSLVLEHIEDLVPVFSQAAASLQPGGLVYLSELHPFKQYAGSKARFETEEGTIFPACYTHHVSDYFMAAQVNGFACDLIREWFDDDNPDLPRILTMLFRKPG